MVASGNPREPKGSYGTVKRPYSTAYVLQYLILAYITLHGYLVVIDLRESQSRTIMILRFRHWNRHVKLLINKPQYLTFPCKKWIRILTRFLEVPYQGGSSETLS